MSGPHVPDKFASWNVADLKEHLKQRGITVTNYKKSDLVRLAGLADELHLPDIDGPNESSPRGSTLPVGLEHPSTIHAWNDDLTYMPVLQVADIFAYLLQNCKWETCRLTRYREERGYRLFVHEHISKVQSATNNNKCYVKCSCLPEQRQNEKPYSVWAILETGGPVAAAGCDCIANDGGCKHVVALLFSLQSWVERHIDRTTVVGTDLACTWDHGRKQSLPSKVIDLKLSRAATPVSMGPTMENFNPCPLDVGMTDTEIETRVYNFCRGTNAVILNSLKTPQGTKSALPELPKTIPQLVVDYPGTPDFQTYLKQVVSKKDIDIINKVTCGQSDVQEWFDYRHCRLTASKIQGQLAICKREWCMFVFSTGKDTLEGRIYFNEKFWAANVKPILCAFYDKCIVPVLLS